MGRLTQRLGAVIIVSAAVTTSWLSPASAGVPENGRRQAREPVAINCARLVNESVTESVYATTAGRDCVQLLARSAGEVAVKHHLAPLNLSAELTPRGRELAQARSVVHALDRAGKTGENAFASMSDSLKTSLPTVAVASMPGIGSRPTGVVTAASEDVMLSPVVVVGTRNTAFVPGVSYSADFFVDLKYSFGTFEALAHGYSGPNDSYLKFQGISYYSPYFDVAWKKDAKTFEVGKTWTIGRGVWKEHVAIDFGTQGEFKSAFLAGGPNPGGFTWMGTVNHLGAFNISGHVGNITFQAGMNHKGVPSGSLGYATRDRGIFQVGVDLSHSPQNGFTGQATIKIHMP